MVFALILALALQAQEPATPADPIPDAVPVPDRWGIPFPKYPLNEAGSLLDPYHQNLLKGDYPILGQNLFFAMSARSDTTIETRRLPTPSGVSTASGDSDEFFGSGEQLFFNQDLGISVDLFHGETAFKPRDWNLRVTGVFDYNYVDVRENAILDPDVAEKTTREDRHSALQEAFVELHLLDVGEHYDFVSCRVGIQPFVSDFRGLMFSDSNLGARLFGTLESNRIQWNLAVFDQLEKDTNSDLNTLHRRGQRVWIGNVYIQDFLWDGYTAQASVHYSEDDGNLKYDDNGFLVRPALSGSVREHDVDVVFFGWAGDGHIGALNLTHQAYAAFGKDEGNPIAGQAVDIAAYLLALELSYDIDWIRLRGSFLWSSGDRSADDDHGGGFDSIFEAPAWAGGSFGFWNRQALRLQGVNLKSRNSHLPDLRSSKTQGQMNFVNPGLFLYNAGVDVELLPEAKVVFNANLFQFHRTESLEAFAFQPSIRHGVGLETSLAVTARPLLTNNVTASLGLSAFFPQAGFADLYESRDTLYSLFAQLTLIY